MSYSQVNGGIFWNWVRAIILRQMWRLKLNFYNPGAGTGIVALTISVLRSAIATHDTDRIITTDLCESSAVIPSCYECWARNIASAMPLLKHNIKLNEHLFPHTRPQAVVLDWDEDDLPDYIQSSEKGFDAIVWAGVCVYHFVSRTESKNKSQNGRCHLQYCFISIPRPDVIQITPNQCETAGGDPRIQRTRPSWENTMGNGSGNRNNVRQNRWTERCRRCSNRNLGWDIETLKYITSVLQPPWSVSLENAGVAKEPVRNNGIALHTLHLRESSKDLSICKTQVSLSSMSG